jgi:hypothetical protein
MRYIIILLFSFSAFAQNGINTPLKACFDCYGGGSAANGWRGKKVGHVNTLNRNAAIVYDAASDTYSGGEHGLLQSALVGYIVYDVSGVIQLGTDGTRGQYGSSGMPDVNNKYVAGQSAPRGGITYTGGMFRLSGNSGDLQDVMFRYIKSRPVLDQNGLQGNSGGIATDDAATWGFLFYGGGTDIMLDHVSASFAYDKAIGGYIDDADYPLERISVINSLIGDSHTSIYWIINPGRPAGTTDNMDKVSVNMNLMTGSHRTPNLGYNGYGEIINNVIFDTGPRWSNTYFDIDINNIGNYYLDPDVQSSGRYVANVYQNVGEGGLPVIYTANNYSDDFSLTGANGEDNRVLWRTFLDYAEFRLADSFFTSTKFTPTVANPWTAISASSAYTEIVTNSDVGANKYLDDDGYVQTYQDPLDAGFIADVVTGTTKTWGQVSTWVLPTMPTNTRPSGYDTDSDGMSDAWEVREYGDLSESYGGDFDGDGYENIEEFLNQVDGVSGTTPTTVTSDVKKKKKSAFSW